MQEIWSMSYIWIAIILSVREFSNLYLAYMFVHGKWRLKIGQVIFVYVCLALIQPFLYSPYYKELSMYIFGLIHIAFMWYALDIPLRCKLMLWLVMAHIAIMGQGLIFACNGNLIGSNDYYPIMAVMTIAWNALIVVTLRKSVKLYGETIINTKFSQIVWLANFILGMEVLALVFMRSFSGPIMWHMVWARIFVAAPAMVFIYIIAYMLRQMELNKEMSRRIDALKQIRVSEKRYYDFIAQSWRNSRRRNHDMHHYGIVMLKYLQLNKYDKLENMIKEGIKYNHRHQQIVMCGHEVIDSVIGYWKLEAVDAAINFETKLNVDKVYIDDMDLSVLLGNVLENAVEAVKRVKNENRYVDVKVATKNGTLLIYVSNSCDGRVKQLNGQFFSAKRNFEQPGVGIESVRQIVESLDGYINIKFTEDCFKIQIAVKNIAGGQKE